MENISKVLAQFPNTGCFTSSLIHLNLLRENIENKIDWINLINITALKCKPRNSQSDLLRAAGP